MRIAIASLFGLAVLGAGSLQADGPTPAEQYRAILADFEAAQCAWAVKLEAAGTDEERRAVRAAYPGPEDYYARMLALAESKPGDAAVVDALAWVVVTSTRGYDDFPGRGVRIKRAMDILARDHLDDPRVGRACLALVAGPAPLRDDFLHTVYASSRDRQVKGRACLALGEFLLKKAEQVAQLKGNAGAELLAYVKTRAPHRLPYVEQIIRLDPADLNREGEDLLERAVAEYADLPYDSGDSAAGDKTLGDVARLDLRRLRSLAAGQEAPEIDGRDVDGARFRLSESRGRVVLLTFSGNWCGPCRAMYPEERALVERLKGRPFVLLSVNTDREPETLRASIAKGEITWRCWWEAGVDGPICERWAMQGFGFPQVYLIDHKGVIRQHGFPSMAETDRTIEELLRACEADAAAAR